MKIIHFGIRFNITLEHPFDGNIVRLHVVRMFHIGARLPALICDNGTEDPLTIQMGVGTNSYQVEIKLHNQPNDELEFEKVGVREIRPDITFEEYAKFDESKPHIAIPTSWEWRPKTLHLSRSRHS